MAPGGASPVISRSEKREMMGAPIDAFDDRVGGALQLVVEAAVDQPAEHRIGGVVAMQGEAGDVRLVARRPSSPGAWS